MEVSLEKDLKKLDRVFKDSLDVFKLEFSIAQKSAAIFFIDGFIDKRIFEDHILKPLKDILSLEKPYYEQIAKTTIYTKQIIKLESLKKAIENITAGEIVLFIDKAEGYFVFSERYLPMRAIQEPPVNNVLRGPREGFSEEIKTNLSLIRKRLYSKDLKIKMFTKGKQSNTKIAVIYINNIAKKEIVNKICRKLDNINIDGIIESSYVARYLEENKNSLFTQVGNSEKPDVIVGKMLEGRVAIIVDGSPSVLTLPFIFFEHLQTAEDYYRKSIRSTMLRTIRVLAMLIAILLPGCFVAMLEFQYNLIPLQFLKAIINSSIQTPLTPTLEMLVVLIIFEILLETSIRMPRYIGMAVSVVGAIVLGDTAVSAGLLASPTIFVIAISTVCVYCVPDEADTVSVLRLIFVCIGGALGLYGIVIAFIAMLSYLVSMENYGSAYFAPYAPSIPHDWQDGLTKNSILKMKQRPYCISTTNRTRQK